MSGMSQIRPSFVHMMQTEMLGAGVKLVDCMRKSFNSADVHSRCQPNGNSGRNFEISEFADKKE
jgi:hypothetical protein